MASRNIPFQYLFFRCRHLLRGCQGLPNLLLQDLSFKKPLEFVIVAVGS